MKKITKCFVFALICSGVLWGQVTIQEIEFRNQPIADVLLALGELAGAAVLPDETVQGYVTYRFVDTTFETAMDILSRQYDIYYERSADGVYIVSKIFSRYDEDTDLVTFKTSDLGVYPILQHLSRLIGKTILYDPLPPLKLSLNAIDVPSAEILKMIMAGLPDYEHKVDENYFQISLKPHEPVTARGNQRIEEELVTRSENGLYNLSVEREDVITVIKSLFEQADREYVLLFKTGGSLSNVSYRNKTMEQLLNLILHQTGGGYRVINNLYYIYDVNRQDILKNYKTTELIQLTHISAEDLPSILPALYSSGNYFKIDRERNAVVLSGSLEEIEPIRDYIYSLDKPTSGKEYVRYDLNYITVNEAVQLLPKNLRTPPPVILNQTNSFISLLNDAQQEQLEQFVTGIDKPVDTHLLTLKYIKAEDFLKNVPPPFQAKDFISTGKTSTLYFKGHAEQFRLLQTLTGNIDTPTPQIRYKLLILQQQEGDGFNFELNLSNRLATDEDTVSAFIGSLSNILSLNFDILSTFGYLFAVKLNASLGESVSEVLADTTLHGLSGEKVSFQNSSTFRYQEQEVDDEGNLQKTGVTQEISTGLFLDVTGWVSGENIITMEVASTLSKKGVSSDSASSNLPSTSERKINTHVRTPSGTPIVIGGLLQKEQTEIISKVPLLGDIPLLGYLFRKTELTDDVTELIIYIVPYLDNGLDRKRRPEVEMDRLFAKFIAKES